MEGVERMHTENGENVRGNPENPREDDKEGDNLELCLKEYQDTLNQSEEPVEEKSEAESIVPIDESGRREEDGGDADLEQCLKEFQETLNQPEELDQTSPEEESIVLNDGFGGKGTEAHEIETKSPEDENPKALSTGGEDGTSQESQEATDKQKTDDGEATQVPEKEEQRTDADIKSQSTKEEKRLPQQSDRSLNQDEERGEFKAERDKNATEEPQPTSEHQEGDLEHNKHQETRANKQHEINESKKTEIRNAKQDTENQEQRPTSPKPSDNPRAFLEANRELLMMEGIAFKNDEAKLDEKTTLKLNVNEGFTIIHENWSYMITTTKQESIGNLVLSRYRTRQGEEFLHIPEQGKVVPPHETPWYALSPDTRIYLEKGYKHELLRAAIAKAGGEAQLRRELKDRETHLCDNYLYRHLREQRESMQAGKLVAILTNLEKDLDEPNSHITAIGNKRAIETPNLPFSLNSTDGARIMAARYSDGTNCTPEGRGPEFDYANNDLECRNRVEESLREVFGRANIVNKEYETGEVPKVRTSTYIIGQTLERAGAVIGEVIEQNPHVPTFILEGSREMKREWLIQAFGDEGYVWPQRGKIRLGRAAEVTGVLSEDMKKYLEQLKWEDKIFHGNLICRAHPYDDLPFEIKEAIGNHPPNLLLEERSMLRSFGINTKMYPRDIYRREGGFGANWILQTETREDGKRFLYEIGFPQERKRMELISMLRLEK